VKKIQLLLCFALFLALFSAFADEKSEVEKMSIPMGESRDISPNFKMETYRIQPSGTNVFKVEEMGSELRVISNSIGEATLIVSGMAENQKKVYTVSVTSNLASIIRMLKHDLDSVSGISIKLNEDRIVISGEVNNPDQWAHLQRVLQNSRYKDCVNFTTFAPSTDDLEALQKRLQEAGFKFAESRETQENGELFLSSIQNTIMISGKLFSNEDIMKLNQVLKTAPLMNMSDDLVKKIIDISLVQTLLEVNVALISLSDSDNFNKQGNVIPTATFDLSFLRRWLDGATTEKTIAIGSNMNGTLSMLQSNLVSKVQDQGTVTIQNGGSGNWSFGGTVKVPVSGTDNGDLKDITYGCTVNVARGELAGLNEAQFDFVLTWEDVKTDAKGNYVQEHATINPGTLPLDLDKTYIIAHHKKETQMTSKYGLPVLRDIPAVGWIFGGEEHSTEVVHDLILVSAERREKIAKKVLDIKSGEVLDQAEKTTDELIKDPDAISKGIDRILQ